MDVRKYRASSQFPVQFDERIVVRDGKGNPVEIWTILGVQKTEKNTYFEAQAAGYRSAWAI